LFSVFNNKTLVQGDIVNLLQFINIIGEGKASKKNLKGIIISNSCDISNDNNILISPVYDFSVYNEIYKDNSSYIYELKKNYICELFYLPEFKEYKGFVADFSETMSFNTELINENLKNDKIKRIATLSLNGWYFLMNKLALYFFRPDSSEVTR